MLRIDIDPPNTDQIIPIQKVSIIIKMLKIITLKFAQNFQKNHPRKIAKNSPKNVSDVVMMRVDIDPPEYRSDYNTEGQ